MATTQTLTYLDVNITSPADGERLAGNSVTVTGTAKAQKETVDTVQQSQEYPEPIDPGALPDGPAAVPLPDAGDDLDDVTGSINKVEVKIESGAGTGQFALATPTGPSDKRWATWTLDANLPRLFRQTTITARVTFGDLEDSTSIRVFGVRTPILARK